MCDIYWRKSWTLRWPRTSRVWSASTLGNPVDVCALISSPYLLPPLHPSLLPPNALLSLPPSLYPPINGAASSPDGAGASRAVPEVNEPPRDIPIPRRVRYLPRFLRGYRLFRHKWEHRRVIANDSAYNYRFKYTVSSVKGCTYIRTSVHTHVGPADPFIRTYAHTETDSLTFV